ncbi:MAG: response regulator [Bryobacteraceae bacterium]
MNKLRILLADDHGIVRRGMRSLLEADPGTEVVGETDNGRDAVRLCETLQPDIAVMDIAMPQLNGIDAAAQAVKQNPRLKVIILSMHSDEAYIVRALTAGARSYLLKESAEDDLLPAVKAVATGKSFFSPSITKTLLDDYVRHLHQRGLQDSYDLLTPREKEILQLLAEGRSNKEVAVLLNVGTSTIETHRTNLMNKLNLHNTADLVLYAVRKKIIS